MLNLFIACYYNYLYQLLLLSALARTTLHSFSYGFLKTFSLSRIPLRCVACLFSSSSSVTCFVRTVVCLMSAGLKSLALGLHGSRGFAFLSFYVCDPMMPFRFLIFYVIGIRSSWIALCACGQSLPFGHT